MQPCHSRGGRSHWDPHFAGSHPYTRTSQGCAGLAPIGPCRRGQTVRVQAARAWLALGRAQGTRPGSLGASKGKAHWRALPRARRARAGAAWPSRAAVGRIKGAARTRAFFPGGGAGGGADGGPRGLGFLARATAAGPAPAPRCTQALLGRRRRRLLPWGLREERTLERRRGGMESGDGKGTVPPGGSRRRSASRAA